MKIPVYDVETYPNCFTYTAIDANTKECVQFEISTRKDDTEKLLAHLRTLVINKASMVGFNNRGFDYTIIHYIIEKAAYAKRDKYKVELSAAELYKEAQRIFDRSDEERRFSSIRDSDVIIPQIDLYLIHHFDNKARSTSLKMLEFNMRSEEIEDLPFEPGKMLTDEEMDTLLVYNKKDVIETLKFYEYSKDAIELRKVLSEQFGFDCTNFNDTKIGKQLFINKIEEESPGACYIQQGPIRKMRQTVRDEIVIADCLFDYIDFSKNRPEFKAVHDWLKAQVITETKGVFSDIMEHDLGDVAKYAEMRVKKIKLPSMPDEGTLGSLRNDYPMGWLEETELKTMETLKDADGNSIKETYIDAKGKERQRVVKVPKKTYHWCYNIAETLNVVINGFRYDFGTGGIHGSKPGTIRSTDKRKIRTLDVASYYPNMAISNEVYPEHLGKTFCKVYKDLYEERKRWPKKTPQNEALKLALNGTYGASNDQFSPLYDPKFTMSITIGGQLSLCMLMGALIDHCDAEIVMANTDGFEYIVDVAMMDKADKIVSRWEDVTGLTMEGDTYDVMFIRDVNNYISVTESGVVKTKGAYEVLPYEKLGWHKNHSAMVVAKAVLHELVEGGCAKDFILNHKDPYDFMLRTKVPRNSRLVLEKDGVEIKLQNICRYYPSTEGGKLIKIMPPLKPGGDERRLGIDVDYNVVPCNNMKDFHWDIDYSYYIDAAEKLIQGVQ